MLFKFTGFENVIAVPFAGTVFTQETVLSLYVAIVPCAKVDQAPVGFSNITYASPLLGLAGGVANASIISLFGVVSTVAINCQEDQILSIYDLKDLLSFNNKFCSLPFVEK